MEVDRFDNLNVIFVFSIFSEIRLYDELILLFFKDDALQIFFFRFL